MRTFLALLTLLALPVAVHAACANPTEPAGSIIFDTTAKAMQYCNGTNWINTGAVIPNAPQIGCTNPTGIAGDVIYANNVGVVQFCNGNKWVDTACAATRKPNGPGCGGLPAGSMKYVGSPVNELQFCDSTDWVAMGYPCGPVIPLNVADVFSTDIYTGNGSTQTITNGIDLAGQGGLVWLKSRNATSGHWIFDTFRGPLKQLETQIAQDEAMAGNSLTSFNSSGFTVGPNRSENAINYVAWTFRKAPKFFDVVTYAGDGVVGRQIAHSLGTAPGMIIIKGLSGTRSWIAYHRSLNQNKFMILQTTDAEYDDSSGAFGVPTTSTFSPGIGIGLTNNLNREGVSYVAYLFAHDPNPDGVIQCGSYTGNGSTTGPVVTLGWQPQFLLIKSTTIASQWTILDSSRGLGSGQVERPLYANLSNTEGGPLSAIETSSTGFQLSGVDVTADNWNANSQTYIYCAIRAEGS